MVNNNRGFENGNVKVIITTVYLQLFWNHFQVDSKEFQPIKKSTCNQQK